MANVTIHTTQNVSIDYETAGLGMRVAAFAFDLLVITVSYLLLVGLALLLDLDINESVVFIFLPLFYILAYFFFFEMLSRGQTAGKMIFKLRVIRLDGKDPTPGDFLARAVFLLPDVLFTFGLQAILLVATGRYQQRLGDIVAKTVVINTQKFGGVSLADVLAIRNRREHEARFPAVQRLTDEDMMLVKQTLRRNSRYRNAAHRLAVSELSDRMAAVLEIPSAAVGDSHEKFLEALLLDYIVLTR